MAFRTALLSSGQIVPRVTIGRETPFFPCERPNANTHYWRLFKATTAYTSARTDAGAALVPLLKGGRHWQSARRLWPGTRRLQLPLDNCFRLVLAYKAIHSIQQTEQIPNDPPRMGRKVLLLVIILVFLLKKKENWPVYLLFRLHTCQWSSMVIDNFKMIASRTSVK